MIFFIPTNEWYGWFSKSFLLNYLYYFHKVSMKSGLWLDERSPPPVIWWMSGGTLSWFNFFFFPFSGDFTNLGSSKFNYTSNWNTIFGNYTWSNPFICWIGSNYCCFITPFMPRISRSYYNIFNGSKPNYFFFWPNGSSKSYLKPPFILIFWTPRIFFFHTATKGKVLFFIFPG
uniref:Ctochrome oxidase I n=1 Tax=Culex quinquefasciatus TaxID=7176 RepID=W8VTD5_CULQU|nr:ctochrome oxidase I [Culex quinquefasciatus]